MAGDMNFDCSGLRFLASLKDLFTCMDSKYSAVEEFVLKLPIYYAIPYYSDLKLRHYFELLIASVKIFLQNSSTMKINQDFIFGFFSPCVAWANVLLIIILCNQNLLFLLPCASSSCYGATT